MNLFLQLYRRIIRAIHGPEPPETVLEGLITKLRHDLTEVRVQSAAAELAARRAGSNPAENTTVRQLNELVKRLEHSVSSAEERRLELIAQLRLAEARIRVEKSLWESQDIENEPAYAVLDDLVRQAEARTAAVQELRTESGQ